MFFNEWLAAGLSPAEFRAVLAETALRALGLCAFAASAASALLYAALCLRELRRR